MIRLMIIADDFTGALDTGVQFAVRGAKTSVLISGEETWEAFSDCDVLVVDSETRHMTAAQAGKKVERFARCAIAGGISTIYKKTDSALRGNIGAELSALWRVGGQRQLHFLPAMPQMGRTTKKGIQMIDGIPVSQSVFGADPFEPVMNSSVTQLIAQQSDIPVFSCPALDENSTAFEKNGIVVYDADTVEDLIGTGRYLRSAGQLRLLAGCAGFAACLPELLDLKGKAAKQMPYLSPCLTVICGSLNPITLTQLDVAEKAGFLRFHLTPRQELEEGYWESADGRETLSVIKDLLYQSPLRILDSIDRAGGRKAIEYAMEYGIGLEEVRIRVSQTMGYLLKQLFQIPETGTLLITGGDTLLQCMESIGVYEVEPVMELSQGIVLFRFVYDKDTRYVISKSGGFGGKNLLPELVSILKEKQEAEGQEEHTRRNIAQRGKEPVCR